MTSEDIDDILILTDKDLCFHNKRTYCCGTTVKGKPCKNQVYKILDSEKKIYTNSQYCKRHHEKFRLEKPEECPICMEELTNVHVPLSCSHWVHRQCIVKWGKDKCPICRTEIKLTSSEKRQIRKLHKHKRSDGNDNISHDYDSEDYDIVLPPQLLELLNSILMSVPENLRDGFMLNLDIQDNSIMLLNDNADNNINGNVDIDGNDEDIIMFSSTEFV